jgi:hypothetical protein
LLRFYNGIGRADANLRRAGFNLKMRQAR